METSNYLIHISNVPNAKNEDRFSKATLTIKGSQVTIIGVYDGHGGMSCAEHISKALPDTIARNLTNNEKSTGIENITSSFEEVDSSLIESVRSIFKSLLSWSMPRSMRQKVIDTKLRDKHINEIALRARSGSTALVAVIQDDHIALSNVGDCRAVLGRTASSGNEVETEVLTIDQNGDNEAERTRILKEHPPTEAQTLFAGNRLFGHTAITRSFGDVFFKEPNTAYTEYIFGSAELTSPGQLPFNQNMARFYPLIKTPPYLIATPTITRYQRSAYDRFLVMASDGVWGLKELTNDWVVRTVQCGIQKGIDPSKYMMEEVQKFKPGDDVTIIVVVFEAKKILEG